MLEYKVTKPMLPAGATSPIMDYRQMEDWLNDMAGNGWTFVSYGARYWNGEVNPQTWWIFSRPAKAETEGNES